MFRISAGSCRRRKRLQRRICGTQRPSWSNSRGDVRPAFSTQQSGSSPACFSERNQAPLPLLQPHRTLQHPLGRWTAQDPTLRLAVSRALQRLSVASNQTTGCTHLRSSQLRLHCRRHTAACQVLPLILEIRQGSVYGPGLPL